MSKEIDIKAYIDIINSSVAQQERLENIYYYVCDYLDCYYSSNDLCEFVDGKCIANRLGLSVHEKDGCCYKLNEGLCKYLYDDECHNRNPSCKFFFCRYVEKKYKAKIKVPYLKEILNRKQQEVIKRSYFHTKEYILDELIKYDRRKYEEK